MTDSLTIDIGWVGASHGAAAERAGMAEVEIVAQGRCLTEVEDRLAATIRTYARISVVHLGQWLAGNWWRLRHEPESSGVDWAMSHSLAAAGGGYLWPAILFFGDGTTMTLRSRATRHEDQPLRYLCEADLQVSLSAFERAVDDLMDRLLARLGTLRIPVPDLEGLWREVRQERLDPAATRLRRLEALLGLDPEERRPEQVMEWAARGAWMGAAALEETLADARHAGVDGRLELLKRWSLEENLELDFREAEALQTLWRSREAALPQPAWQRGQALASMVRTQLGLGAIEPISDDTFRALTGADVLTRPSQERLGAAFRKAGRPGRVSAVLPHRYATSRRFAAARILGDLITAPAEDRVLPLTDAATARQKLQRAFAQELLCPTEGLMAHLDLPNPQTSDLEAVAEHYQVSSWTVRSALVNRGLVDRSYLPAA